MESGFDGRVECPYCGKEVAGSLPICPHCYRELKFNCPHCGEIVRWGWERCPYCATVLPLEPSSKDS